MKVAVNTQELDLILDSIREKNMPVGFVATMGALHEGHLSLIELAKKDNKVVVCSIFVNPTQFNDPADLQRYPRPIEEDKKMLEAAGCDVLFMPTVEQMYPGGDFSTLQEDFGVLDKVMEGKARPGHFAGMITIVNKLFMAVKPHNAYFGQKDYQQLAIIKRFIEKHVIPINIISCPIVREADGLAMSSRNRLLNAEERKHATLIPKTMFRVKELWEKDSVDGIKRFVENEFVNDSFLKLDYFEISDARTLQPLENKESIKSEGTPMGQAVACIAIFDGKIRLIDNVLL